MSGIKLQNDLINFYGNLAGYIKGNCATVDRIFQCDELNEWLGRHQLAPKWADGVMEHLQSALITPSALGNSEDVTTTKGVRIWQLQPDADVKMKFISFKDMVEQFGNPKPESYCVAYDGEMVSRELEIIYDHFRNHPPSGFEGHPLSMSDVIELYDSKDSEFHYIDRMGFRQINFK